MIGEQYPPQAPRKEKLRRYILPPLLLVPITLGGVSVALWRSASSSAPATFAVPTETARQSGESPGNSQIVPTLVPTPVPTLVPTPVPTPVPSVSGGGTGVARVGDAGFTITGSVSGLRPGVAMPIRLTLTNPNGLPIYVTALTVTVSANSSPAGCSSAANLHVTPSNASGADPIVIAANGSVTLASAPRAPQITLLNLPGVNQDVCKGKSFVLTYSGSAHS